MILAARCTPCCKFGRRKKSQSLASSRRSIHGCCTRARNLAAPTSGSKTQIWRGSTGFQVAKWEVSANESASYVHDCRLHGDGRWPDWVKPGAQSGREAAGEGALFVPGRYAPARGEGRFSYCV